MTRIVFPAYVEIAENRFRERFGLDYEDFKVDQIFKHRPGYTLTQQDNINECLDTLNQAMLHYDTQYASQTEFSQPLIVTTLIVQRLIGMTWKTFNKKKAIVRWAEIIMKTPVFAGDTLYSESTVTALSEQSNDPECGLVTIRTIGRNQRNDEICHMDYDCLIYKRDYLPFANYNY